MTINCSRSPALGLLGDKEPVAQAMSTVRSAKTIQHLSSRSVCQRAKRLRAIGSLLNSWRICRGSQPGTTPRPFDLNPQVLRSCVMLDRDLVLDAIEDAQRILAAHIEPGSHRSPETTITMLVCLLDRHEVVAPVKRLRAGNRLRVVNCSPVLKPPHAQHTVSTTPNHTKCST